MTLLSGVVVKPVGKIHLVSVYLASVCVPFVNANPSVR
jgi:hypothetical protein